MPGTLYECFKLLKTAARSPLAMMLADMLSLTAVTSVAEMSGSVQNESVVN